jgi:segregation and condensation protein B
MSLKAKLEAVIYAAEEPVTLAQLALLFTEDALQWKAEQNAAAALAADSEDSAADSLPLIEETLDSGALVETAQLPDATVEAQGDENASEASGSQSAAAGITENAAAAEAPIPSEGEATTAAAAETDGTRAADSAQPAAAESAEDGESQLKREARQRDRDVRNVLRAILDELIAEYAADDRGIEIREVAGGYRMATKPECHDAVRGFVKRLKPPLKLSLPALETLAVIAYKQPVTAPEVNEIRGVDSSGVFGSLLSRKLIATAGRKQVVGRPILYKTTREFLLRFGLKDVSELPSMEEFEKLAASELEEPETQTEGEAAEESGAAPSPELDEAASEEPESEAEASNPTEPVAEKRERAGEDSTASASADAPQPPETEQVSHD